MGVGCSWKYHPIEVDYHIQYNRKGREQPRGEGAFAQVRACTCLKTKQLRAVKSIEKKDSNIKSYASEEVRILRLVSGQHPAIIEFIDVYEEWNYLHLVFEYAVDGTVEEAIEGQKLSSGDKLCATLMKQLFEALMYLKSVSILHRDVKPSNLLLTSPTSLKLGDFGVACECLDNEPLKSAQGTPSFFSPEMYTLPRSKGYLYPADVWAAGITMYMMLFDGAHPFAGSPGGRVSLQQLKKGDFSVGWMTSSAAANLLSWLLLPSPKQRCSSEDALRHPWFSSFGLGDGDFTKELPRRLVPDSHGNWMPYD